MNNIFDPKNVALIGASEKEGSIGEIILKNLLGAKDRRVFPVNPNRRTVLGIECFQDVRMISDSVDLAVIATPANVVPDVLERCGMAGIGGAVIVSAGFSEAGPEGRLLEQQVSAARKKYEMRILGPSCLGFIRPSAGLNVSFLKTSPVPGHIAFVSQSGALGSAILDWAADRHVGFSIFAELGSMIDIDFGDLIDFLSEDDDTKSILLYMETVGNAKKFMSAARAFAIRKPIIILKPKRLTESAKTQPFHLGALAGNDAIYEAAFKRAGAIRVGDIADLFNAAKALDWQKLPDGARLAVVSPDGGLGIMAADELIKYGGRLAILTRESNQQLDMLLPQFCNKDNPINVQGDANAARYAKATAICLEDPQVDGILVVHVFMDGARPQEVAKAVIDVAKRARKPVILACVGAGKHRVSMEALMRNSIPSYETPEEAVRAYMCMYQYKRNIELLYETPAELHVQEAPNKEYLRDLLEKVREEGRTFLDERESKDFFANYGIPVTAPHITSSIDGAMTAAHVIGYPVVIKIASFDIAHKSDIGGVITGIYSDEQLRQAYENIMARARQRAPAASIRGIIVQRMIEGIDYELVVRSKKDRDFGTVILFGMGGTTAEFISDFSIGLPPLNQIHAKRLIEETKAYEIIQGWRSRPPVDLRQVETVLVNFSHLVIDFPEVAEIDMNPLAIAGGKLFALDGRIILEKETAKSSYPYSHLVITPYPKNFLILWTLPDGTEMRFRAIRPEDEPLEHEFISTLSAESRCNRFFMDLKNLSHQRLVTFCNIDYERHMAVVAEVKEGRQRKIKGVARLVLNPDFDSAEIAVLVHDSFQRRGVGKRLMEVVIQMGRWKGLREINGQVLKENGRMLDLCRRLGFSVIFPRGETARVALNMRSHGSIRHDWLTQWDPERAIAPMSDQYRLGCQKDVSALLGGSCKDGDVIRLTQYERFAESNREESIG